MNVERLARDLARDEGKSLKLYRCSMNKLTIGIGRNIEDNGISEEEAAFLFGNDVARATAELRDSLPYFDNLDDTRQEVLVNMVFNLGITRFLGFHSMIAALEGGDYEAAAREMESSRWATQVGARAARLAARMERGEE